MKHLSDYGTACMFSGQFDAGECYVCYAKRKKMEVEKLREMVLFYGGSDQDLNDAKEWSKDNRWKITKTTGGTDI